MTAARQSRSRAGAPTIRIWAAVTAVYGAALIALPSVITRRVDQPAALVVRVLGVREIGQGVVLLACPRREVALVASGVDALHAASMVAAALVFPAYRRSALTSAGVAALSAAAGIVLGRRLR